MKNIKKYTWALSTSKPINEKCIPIAAKKYPQTIKSTSNAKSELEQNLANPNPSFMWRWTKHAIKS